MSTYIPARMRSALELGGLLEMAARESALALHKAYKKHTRQSRGATLRPGPSTPLWNELARIAASELNRYGDKARLARILGVPRQRIHEYLIAKTACPDTERALRLLAWLLKKQAEKPPIT